MIIAPLKTDKSESVPGLRIYNEVSVSKLPLVIGGVLTPFPGWSLLYMKVPKTHPIGERLSTTAKSTWIRRSGDAKSFRSLPLLVDLEMTCDSC